MLRKASDTVDFISSKVKKEKINETVTASFVTVMIELEQEAVETISKQSGENVSMNLRFLKPSKQFYKKLVCYWFKFLPQLKAGQTP